MPGTKINNKPMAKPDRKEPTALVLPAQPVHNGLKQFAANWSRIRRFAAPKHLTLTAAGACVLLVTTLTVLFLMPRTITFSFAGKNCFASPTLFPNLVAKKQGRSFAAEPQTTIAVAGYPLYSHTACVTPTQAPEDNISETISFSPLGVGFIRKNIRVSTGSLPQVEYKNILTKPIAPNEPLVLPLSSADYVFEYHLRVGDQTANCNAAKKAKLVCDIAKLNLEQSTAYTLSLQRLFNGELHKTLFSESVTTVGAVTLSESSITNDQTVYDVPKDMTLTFNKDIKSFDGVELVQISGDERRQIPITTSTKDATLTIAFGETLARQTTFELTIQNVTSPDGGHLPEPLKLTFKTSGGPQVKGINIDRYKVSLSTNITLTFDTAVSGSQKLSDFIKVEANGKTIDTKLNREDNRVVINPDANLPRCAALRIRVLDGLENEHGISGGSAWSYNSRTICQETFSIGTSVQGRSITGYRFGSGNSAIVFVGTTHGDEKSSTHTLNSLIDYLERNPDVIPGHRTVVIIPNLNPDGYQANRRTNANGVDLNRNFPTNNWKKDVTMPGGWFNAGGGGSAPLSEPESKALADYLIKVKPRLVLTYHAAAGVVMPNDSGDSDELAQIYDQKSNLNYEPNNQTGQIFQYDTTGALEDWLHDKHDIPALLVELWTLAGNEFNKNKDAMLHMITLP